MEALIAFWTHALAAALFASLTLWELRRGLPESEQRMLLAAFALTVSACASSASSSSLPIRKRSQPGVGRRPLPPRGIDSSEEQLAFWPVYAAVAAVLAPAGGRCLPLVIDTRDD